MNLSSISRKWTDSDFTGLGANLPTNLSAMSVIVNGLPAAVYYVDPGQVSLQVPAGTSGTASVQVLNKGVGSNIVTGASVNNAPGIFPVVVNGTNYAGGIFPDGEYVGDPSIGPGFRKAKPGDSVQLFATGLVPSPAGMLVGFQAVGEVSVTIGNITIPADAAGLVAVGEFQINFTLPQQLPDHDPSGWSISPDDDQYESTRTTGLPIQH